MPRILVVDDEKSIRAFYTEELSDEGYKVITTDGCEKAWGIINSEQPDAVILDIRMEDCDGLDLLQESRNAYPVLPIILNTAYDSYREDVKSVAADYYVVKSQDLSELKTLLARIMKKKTG